MDLKNPETGQRKSLEPVVFCSVNNSTNGGSKICNITNKIYLGKPYNDVELFEMEPLVLGKKFFLGSKLWKMGKNLPKR